MAHVRFAARDPGGANVLAAFLGRHREKAGHHRDVWALERAASVFEAAGVAVRQFPRFAIDELTAAWRASPAEVLVTGTSHYAPFEPLLWKLAAEDGAPSLAVLDSWANLDRRFGDGRPDFVGAVDSEQVRDVLALGFRGDRVLVTGHPFLQALLERPAAPDAPEGAATRVLFISEPIAEDVVQGANATFGFDQVDSFLLVVRAARACGRPVEVTVKFHPYEERTRFLEVIAALPAHDRVRVRASSPSVTAHAAVAGADLICGIGSMLLLEAIAAGRPVVSVQPGLAREDTFIASRRGFVPLLADPVAGEAEVAALLCSPGARRALLARNREFLATVDRSGGAGLARWIAERIAEKTDGQLTTP